MTNFYNLFGRTSSHFLVREFLIKIKLFNAINIFFQVRYFKHAVYQSKGLQILQSFFVLYMFTVYVLYSEKWIKTKTDQDQNVGIIHKFELIDKGRKEYF